MDQNKIDYKLENELIIVPLSSDHLDIDERKIGYSIGYPNGEMPPHFKDLIQDVLQNLRSKCKIQSGFRIVEMSYKKGENYGLYVNDIYFKMDRIVTSQLRKADHAALFICTIGPEMEEWSKELAQKGDLVQSYLIDNVASAAVENVADLLHDNVRDYAEKNFLKITNRYSPGYCNWDVKEQQKLFSFFSDNSCGVSLSDSSLMFPIKSISGIIGMGKDVSYNEYLCDRCGIKDCTHRIYLSRRSNQNRSND